MSATEPTTSEEADDWLEVVEEEPTIIQRWLSDIWTTISPPNGDGDD